MPAERQTAIQAVWLNPLLSAHSAWVKSDSLGIAPEELVTMRTPTARYVREAAE